MVAAEPDRGLQAGVGRLHARSLEEHRLQAVGLQRLGDAAGMAGGGHARIGDHEDASYAVLGEVEPDLVGRTGTELQRRGGVGEDGLPVVACPVVACHPQPLTAAGPGGPGRVGRR